jgi:hypothetical protein
MKTSKTFFTITGTVFFLSLFLPSCHVTKKASIDCPEFSQNRLVKNKNARNSTKKIFAERPNHKKYSYKSIIQKEVCHKGSVLSKGRGALILDPHGIPGNLSKTDYLNNLVVSTENKIIIQTSLCDTIFMLSGAWMTVKIDNIGHDKIQFMICDSIRGTINSISKFDVAYIKYSSGVREQIAKCDTIFLISGGCRCVKIVKETQSKIMFRKYNNQTGPIITISKSDVSAVKYYVEEHTDAGKNNDSISANIKNNEVENNNELVAKCDTIFLISGGWKCVKIVKETQSTIMFRKYDNPTGRILTISKSELSAVKYGNNETIPANTNNSVIQRTEPLATVGFISLITSTIFFRPLYVINPLLWLFLLLMGPILGAASLINIKKHPEKYKGKGLARFSIVMGLLVIGIILFFLSLFIIGSGL